MTSLRALVPTGVLARVHLRLPRSISPAPLAASTPEPLHEHDVAPDGAATARRAAGSPLGRGPLAAWSWCRCSHHVLGHDDGGCDYCTCRRVFGRSAPGQTEPDGAEP